VQATPARHLAVCRWQAGRRDRDRRCRLRAPRADARRGPTRARGPGQSDSSPATAANIAAVDAPEASRMTAVTPSTANSSTATRDRSSQSRNRWGFAGGTVLAACVWSRADRAPLRGLTLWRPTRRRPRGRCGHLRVPRKQENGRRPGWPFSHARSSSPRAPRFRLARRAVVSVDVGKTPARETPGLLSLARGSAGGLPAYGNDTGPPPVSPAAAQVLRGGAAYFRKSTSSSFTRSASSWWTQWDALGRRSTRSRFGTSSWCGSASFWPR
jgi:hypothetical protein